MTPTRRIVLIGGSAALVAPFLHRDAFADGTVLCWHDRTLDHYTTLHDAAINDGYRLVSLSIYGPATAPIYTAVMIKRTQAAEQRHWPLTQWRAADANIGGPGRRKISARSLIAATGPASDPRFALVCERQDTVSRGADRIDDQDAPTSRRQACKPSIAMPESKDLVPRCDRELRQRGGAVLRRRSGVSKPAQPHGTPTAWSRPTKSCRRGMNAQASGWCRPSLHRSQCRTAASPRSLSTTRSATGQARHGLTAVQYRAGIRQPGRPRAMSRFACRRRVRAPLRRKFSAVFVQRETPLQRTFTAAGPTQNAGHRQP